MSFVQRKNDLSFQNIQEQSIYPVSNTILPLDTVTSISWLSNNEPCFGVTSFDGFFRLYKIEFLKENTNFNLIYVFKYKFPLTCFEFIPNSNFVAIGTCNGELLIIDQSQGIQGKISEQFNVLGTHSNPMFKIFLIEQMNSLMTVDTVNEVKIWDLNKMQMLDQFQNEKIILDCDFIFPILVLAFEGNIIRIMDINNPQK